ncbi:MAG: LEA type 2 family protein [Treponema sp.]|nr:LEA type 2 family protein [Treponema sp.]
MRKFLSVFITVLFLSGCKSQTQVQPQIIAEIEEIEIENVIEIIEPEFEVVSIVILQADLVVTEFKTVIKVTNPNDFALELTELTYELYGNGEYWEGNTARESMQIPSASSSETVFVFQMNFINNTRNLLNEVIAMRQVNYIFKGKAKVQPDIQNIGPFIMNYDCRGLSEVKRRAEK